MLIQGLLLRTGKTKAGKFVSTIFDSGAICAVMTNAPIPGNVGDTVKIEVRPARPKDGGDPFFFGAD